MANDDKLRDERFGRRQHEGLNAGISRNAHTSGSSREGGAREAGPGAADDAERGRGGYGDDTGFTGGTQGATDDDATEPTDRGTSSADAQPGAGGTYEEPSAVEARSRTGAVGRQAPSGMDEPARGGEHG